MHIYKGRGLPAADLNGSIDPYMKARFMGQASAIAFCEWLFLFAHKTLSVCAFELSFELHNESIYVFSC